MELLTKDDDFQVYVDFAHTPAALQAVLASMRNKGNRIVIVLGTAGNKDKSKRPAMGKIACAYADHVIFTAEDPRDENPQPSSGNAGATSANNYEIITDRKTAIRKAVFSVKPAIS